MPRWVRAIRHRLMIWHSRGLFSPFCRDCRRLRAARRAGEDYWHDEPLWYLRECWERAEPARIVAACVDVDLNVRVRGNHTVTGIDDVHGPIAVGDDVLVREPESGARGDGTITEIDTDRGLVYLTVDWGSITFPDTWATGPSQTWAWTPEHGARRVS